MGDGIWTGDSYIPDMGTLGDLAGPGGYRGGSSDSGSGWIATLVMLAPVALNLMSQGEGDLISDCEAVLGGPYSTGAAIRWRTVRVWKQRVVVAERIEGLASVDQQVT